MNAPWRGMTALVVDDDELITIELTSLLTNLGVQVRGSAFSAPEALLKVEDLRPDFVTMDIHLGAPGEGLAAVTLLRATDLTTRVLFVTGRYDPERADELRSLGPAEVVVKPVSALELEEALGRLFGAPSPTPAGIAEGGRTGPQ